MEANVRSTTKQRASVLECARFCAALDFRNEAPKNSSRDFSTIRPHVTSLFVSFVTFCSILLLPLPTHAATTTQPDRLRLIIETDAGGDPDDEQSLVRFLLYANEWDIEHIIANRAKARDGENKNKQRTGLDIVQQLIRAYGQCHTNLVQHDPRYPTAETLLSRTIAGYTDTPTSENPAVQAIINAVDRPDPRPLWYIDWGTDAGATNSFQRVMDKILAERSAADYAKFKNKLRVIFHDRHITNHTALNPPWPLWVNTWEPPMDGKRWYHRFSALTATAGGFNLREHVLNNGPLGALYPTNTTHWQKEGDTPAFLYLIPTGMNDPNQPTWGSWAGRYGPHDKFPNQPTYYWANQPDTWNGATNRDNTLLRWAVHLQNDFRARLDWSTKPFSKANHPPSVKINNTPGIQKIQTRPNATITLTPTATDSDKDKITFHWIQYREPSTYKSPLTLRTLFNDQLTIPADAANKTIHLILIATDNGSPPLTRYARAIVEVTP